MAPLRTEPRRPTAPGTLAGLAEIAKILDVHKNTASKYSRRADFPQPLDLLASGPVWTHAAVERWKRAHWPLKTGRPPRSTS